MVQRALEQFGRIDILVNNAAYRYGPDRVPLIELDPDIFQKVIDVKVRGTYMCSKAVAKVLIEQGQGGKIVTIASSAGKRATATTLAYNAANFAQVGMTQSMALDLGPHNINVNAVCPGLVDTSRLDPLGRGDEWQERSMQAPIGRSGTPARGRRPHRLPLHRGRLMDPRPVHQHRRRNGHGVVRGDIGIRKVLRAHGSPPTRARACRDREGPRHPTRSFAPPRVGVAVGLSPRRRRRSGR